MRPFNSHSLDKKVFKYVKRFGVKKVHYGLNFECALPSKIVYYTFKKYNTDKMIEDFIKNTYGYDISEYSFIFSLLHEVGHCVTYNQLSKKDIDFENIMRESLVALTGDFTKANLVYFTLPSERLATEWALKYIDEHTQECWNAQQEFFEVLKKCGRR